MPSLATELFDYTLPAQLIAQAPSARRDQSRLLVIDRTARTTTHRVFSDLTRFLQRGDTLFRNDAAVIPARLVAQRPTGGRVECFLLRPSVSRDDDPKTECEVWECLVKPGKKLPVGAIFAHPGGDFTGKIMDKLDSGTALVGFTTRNRETVLAAANRLGKVPLPPYIERPDDSPLAVDRERYQTVYASHQKQVAVAAPTAGLHFTPELLAALRAQGVGTADSTLQVGLGTFKPITTDTVEAHAIHHELYELPVATQRALFPPLAGRRVAVGTTTVRTIEDFLASHQMPKASPHVAEARIFIYPPRQFRGVDALITNFHQPRSTLLCLVAAFLTPGSTNGIEWLREIYAEAIRHEYRFLSYGDAMLIL